jgi:hypothetical protein
MLPPLRSAVAPGGAVETPPAETAPPPDLAAKGP